MCRLRGQRPLCCCHQRASLDDARGWRIAPFETLSVRVTATAMRQRIATTMAISAIVKPLSFRCPVATTGSHRAGKPKPRVKKRTRYSVFEPSPKTTKTPPAEADGIFVTQWPIARSAMCGSGGSPVVIALCRYACDRGRSGSRSRAGSHDNRVVRRRVADEAARLEKRRSRVDRQPVLCVIRLDGRFQRPLVGPATESWPWSVMPRTANTVTVARMPRMTMTMRSSTRVNPLSCLFSM